MPKQKLDYTPDLLLVMPSAKADKEDIDKTFEEVHGTVLGSLGEGALKCYVVRTEKGKLEETEKKLTKDSKHFAAVGRNYTVTSQLVPNDKMDPDFTNQWHLSAMKAPRAWDFATGSGVRVAVFDTGCAASNSDLMGHTDRGFDAHSAMAKVLGAAGGFFGFLPIPGVTELAGAIAGAVGGAANNDKHGHGTKVATTMSGTLNNPNHGVGIAPNVKIYPIRIAEETYGIGEGAKTTDLELIAAMIHVMSKPDIRIINISYSVPFVGFANPAFHLPLHNYFRAFWMQRSGLIFMSAGNYKLYDPTPKVPYLEVVSAIDSSGGIANYGGEKGSTFGHFVSFTGPGQDIICSDQNNAQSRAAGTSLSCPLVAGVAALILDKKPMMPNFEVLRTMIRSCTNSKGTPWNPFFGWGMPDAGIAVQLAMGKSMEEARRPPAAQGGSPNLNVAGGSSTPPPTPPRGGAVVAPIHP